MTSLRTNLFVVALALAFLGNVMVYSATSAEGGAEYGAYSLATRFAHLGIGIIAFFVTRGIRYTAWRRIAAPLYAGVFLSLVLVLFVGREISGARRWIDVGPLQVQPAEFAKLAAVVLLASVVSRARPGSGLPWRAIGAVGVLFALVLVEPDFGTSVVISAGAAGVLWASESKTRDLLLAGSGALVLLVGAMLAAPYRRERFLTFLDPLSVCDGSGYQICQSMNAIREGSYLGAGPGAGGVPVPEMHTDMIFALVGEELGLLGMFAVIGAFGFFVVSAYLIALNAPTVLGRCLAAGLATMFAVQVVFNIGATMSVVPLAGMTLPFVSYGGSSVLVCFAAVGILYRISEDSEVARVARRAPSGERRGSAHPDRRRRDGGTRDPRAVRGG
ncbi:FtsW/RodA/SpoVE family cell cycle protein [Rubrobacter marinus]|uniref:FtsW/RodA/SpoVE family cell cycle protein n=1 Tax=Rubrobacter marinus TaxID=2653852 RepID=UPI00140A2395|nr:FtsW/RodA/SpoVE family cell cycle protein [Rubrobacter marinus]